MHKKLLLAYMDIPIIRAGKADVIAMISYKNDCEAYRKMIGAYFKNPSKAKRILSLWKKYIELRNSEDFCPHSDSIYRNDYLFMFDITPS